MVMKIVPIRTMGQSQNSTFSKMDSYEISVRKDEMTKKLMN